MGSQLPREVVRQRGDGRERVLDRRKLLDLARDPRSIAVVEIVAEKVRVIGVIPCVLFLGGGFRVGVGLLYLGGRIHLLLFLGLRLLEQRVLDDLLVQHVDELQRRHRQQLDGLLQRWRQDQLLRQPHLEFLINRHKNRSDLLLSR